MSIKLNYMNQTESLIGFIGQGFIGKNMADDFESRGYRVVRYDNHKYASNKEGIRDCDYVFIAVPTPSTPAGFDDSILAEVLSLVGEGKTAIIKSTIKVGTTEKFQKLYANKYILHSPEFLTEKNAALDSKFPPRNIVGYSAKAKEKAKLVLELLPKAKYELIVKSGEAELIKYMGNNFLYLKVIFANLVYNLCQRKGLDYNIVAEAVGHDARIGSSHLQIKHQSGLKGQAGRGAGGNCFIKDMAAFIEMFEEEGIENKEDKLVLDVLHSISKLNQRLLIDSQKDVELLQSVYGDLD